MPARAHLISTLGDGRAGHPQVGTPAVVGLNPLPYTHSRAWLLGLCTESFHPGQAQSSETVTFTLSGTMPPTHAPFPQATHLLPRAQRLSLMHLESPFHC